MQKTRSQLARRQLRTEWKASLAQNHARRHEGLRRDDWDMLQKVRCSSKTEFVANMLKAWERWALMDWLRAHHVFRLTFSKWRTAGVGIRDEGYDIHFPRGREVVHMIEDLGHEMAHVYLFHIAVSDNFHEEEFCEEFGLAWAAVPRHRLEARKLFCALIQTDELYL
jgi:hypothetical protein